MTWPSSKAEGLAAAASMTRSTHCASTKWLPEPIVPSWREPRSFARAETVAGSAPGSRPPDSVRSRSSDRPDAVPLDQRPRSLDEDAVELVPAQRDAATLPGAGRHAAGDLVDQVDAALTQLGLAQRQGEQAARRS